ncbi:MAG: hypothetical protein ACLT98_13980 [Eggerthellaceae bacterium]
MTSDGLTMASAKRIHRTSTATPMSPVAGAAASARAHRLLRRRAGFLDENGERFCNEAVIFRQGSCDRRAGEAERADGRKSFS